MFISGNESYSAEFLADMLSGDAILLGDTDGVHGALICLCRRVAEQQAEIQRLSALVDRLAYRSDHLWNERSKNLKIDQLSFVVDELRHHVQSTQSQPSTEAES